MSSPTETPVETATNIPTEITTKYDGLTEVHRGGMGVVYRGRHRHLDRWDAIKLILPYQLRDENRRQRFLREARIASRFKHRHIVRIHDFEVTRSGTPYLVMELIEGRMLASILGEEGPPPLPRALTIAQQIAQALGYIHNQGYVHRDVSAKNLMLESEDPPRVKLVDLGIAKRLGDGDDLTRSDVFLFNARYASPEHFKNSKDLDSRSDLYSCGVVLYELFTGQRPFRGESMEELVGGHLFEAPLPFMETDPQGHLPAPLRQILRRTLEKDPEARFQRAEDLARELEKVQGTKPPTPISIDTGATTASRQALLDFALHTEESEAVQSLASPTDTSNVAPPAPKLPEFRDAEDNSTTATEIRVPKPGRGISRKRFLPGLSLVVLTLLLLPLEAAAPWPGFRGLPPVQLLPVPGQGEAEPAPTNHPELRWAEAFEMVDQAAGLHPEFPYFVQLAVGDDTTFAHPVLEFGLRRAWSGMEDVQLPQVTYPVPAPEQPVQVAAGEEGREFLADGEYLWRVARQNDHGELFGFSAVGRFIFDVTPAQPPELVSDNERVTNNPLKIFTWVPPADAVESMLQIAREESFQEPLLWDESLTVQPEMSWQVPDSRPLPEGDIFWRVGSIDAARNPVQFSAPKHFVVDVTPPALPVPVILEGPLNQPRPIFAWSSVRDAFQYEIVIKQGTDCRDNVLREKVETPTFRPAKALPEQRVCWWLRSRDEAGNWRQDFVSGGVLELDYTNPPTPPAACAAQALTNDAQPWLEWTATEDTAAYQLQLARDEGFHPLLRDVPELPSGQGAAWKAVSRLPEGEVFWRVKSRDRAGNESPYSTACRLLIDTVPPKIPTLRAVRPVRSRNLRPDLGWSLEADATSYRLQVARDPSFKELVPTESEPSTNRYLPVRDLPEGELFWRVASRDEAGNHSKWSKVGRFEIDITPPDQPKLREMSPNPTRESRPTVRWETVRDAQTYQVQVASEASFSQPILDERVTTTTFRPPRLLPEGDIFWRVQSFDAVGNKSGFSAVSWFEVDSTPPAVVRLDPILETVREPRLTLRWQPVSDAADYLVQVDRDAGFSAPSEESTDNPWLELRSLREGTWFWRVKSRDAAGNWSPFSAAGQFQVDRTAPPPPELIPVDMGQGRFPYLHWEPVHEVDSYVVQLSFDPAFGDLLDEVEVASTWFQIDRVLPPGRVYWRVASRDAAGNGGRFSSPGAFDLY